MALAHGTHLGPYEIIDLLGAGGMGEVYRARDGRLGREVAIKVLPPECAQDADRLRRFETEARSAGQLNHPNVLSVYDTGTHAGAPFIVAELLVGSDLRALLAEGPLPPRKTLDYAQQIAHGLAAAHGKGIVHRDLKPENLFVTSDGRIKILDFGLAKLKEPAASASGAEAATSTGTNPGVVIGTATYMAPEQVRGQETDHRTDIFAFGVILYEMLSGKRPFLGETAAETMTSILKTDAPEMPPETPPALERLVRRCLEKQPAERFQGAADVGFALEALSASSGARLSGPAVAAAADAATSSLGRRSGRLWMASTAMLALALSAVIPALVSHFRERPPEKRLVRLSVPPPGRASFGSLAVSPDGRTLAFTATAGGTEQLWIRPLDSIEAQPVQGTEGASFPFWSPDSRSIAFHAGGKLKRIEISGGPARTVCDSGVFWGGTWSRDGVILFAGLGFGLFRVPASGGTPAVILRVDIARQESEIHSPAFLPDGRHYLFNRRTARTSRSRGIWIGSLEGGESRRLVDAGSNGIYAPPGYLLFMREGALLAQPFDLEKLELSGEAAVVAGTVGRAANFPRGSFSVSDTGVLVYDPSTSRQSKQLHWVDRRGKPIRSLGALTPWSRPALSPDGKRFVVDRLDEAAESSDIWVYDTAGGEGSRLTFDPADDVFPVWSPNGSRIVWGSTRKGTYDLYWKSATGEGADESILQSDELKIPNDWSSDGRYIVYYVISAKTRRDLWLLPQFGDRKPVPFLQSESNEVGGRISTDGRWIAYASDESGGYEIYVRSFPSGAGRWQVSNRGGTGPEWRRDGREIYYYSTDGKLMAAEVKAGGTFETRSPRELFEFRSGHVVGTSASYAVTADGEQFLISALVDESGGAPLVVVLDWTAALRR